MSLFNYKIISNLFCWCFSIWLSAFRKQQTSNIYFHQKLINKQCVNLHCELNFAAFFTSTVANWIIIKARMIAGHKWWCSGFKAGGTPNLRQTMICTWQLYAFSFRFSRIQHQSQLFNSFFDSFAWLTRLIYVIVFLVEAVQVFGKQLLTEYETYVNLSEISGKQKKRTQIWEKKEQKMWKR